MMMKKIPMLLVVSAAFLSACGLLINPGGDTVPGMPGLGDRTFGGYDSNGEQIYYTGTTADGGRVGYTGGPAFGGMMMGSQLSCASCHGDDGRGGTHTMHMDVMDAPDIRLAALQGELEEQADSGEEDDHDDGHDEGHQGYDLETFKQAVVLGQHPGGEPLNRDMPKWDLGDEDLADLFEFISSFE